MCRPKHDHGSAGGLERLLSRPQGVASALRLHPYDLRGVEPHRCKRQRVRRVWRLDHEDAALTSRGEHWSEQSKLTASILRAQQLDHRRCWPPSTRKLMTEHRMAGVHYPRARAGKLGSSPKGGV